MPVDPTILYKYDPPPRNPGPRREGSLPLIIAGAGTGAILLFATIASLAPGLIPAFFVLTVLAWLLAGAGLLYIGYQEGGITGVLFQRRFPLGSELSGEPPASWMRYSVGWLLILASVLCGLLIAKHPDAVPESWLHRHRGVPTVRERLLQ